MPNDPITTAKFIVRSNRGYYFDEEGGAYLWVKARKHALRMTKDEAGRIAGYPSRMSAQTSVGAANGN